MKFQCCFPRGKYFPTSASLKTFEFSPQPKKKNIHRKPDARG